MSSTARYTPRPGDRVRIRGGRPQEHVVRRIVGRFALVEGPDGGMVYAAPALLEPLDRPEDDPPPSAA